MTFPEVLSLRNCSVKDLLNKCLLMYDDFPFMYTSDTGGKP